MAFVFYRTFTRYIGVAFVTAAVAGCASIATTPEATVKARATQQWQARITGDLDTSYKLTTPSFRGATTLENYKKGFGGAVVIKSAEVATVTCENADKCVVNAKVEAQPNLVLGRRTLPPFTTYIDETWLREDGQWWLFPTP